MLQPNLVIQKWTNAYKKKLSPDLTFTLKFTSFVINMYQSSKDIEHSLIEYFWLKHFSIIMYLIKINWFYTFIPQFSWFVALIASANNMKNDSFSALMKFRLKCRKAHNKTLNQKQIIIFVLRHVNDCELSQVQDERPNIEFLLCWKTNFTTKTIVDFAFVGSVTWKFFELIRNRILIY